MNPIPVTWCAAGALVLSVGAFGAGWQVRSWKAGSDQSAALLKASAALKKAGDDILHVSGLYEQEKADAAPRSIERQTELRTIYHETTIPAECAAPDAARRVLENSIGDANSAARGQPRAALPGPAPTP